MKHKLVVLLFPMVVMGIITVLTFSSLQELIGIDFFGIFVLLLVVFNPLCFFVQGILCKHHNINLFLGLGMSLLTFYIIIITVLNESAYGYIPQYLIYGLVGYGAAYLTQKYKIMKHEKVSQ